MDAEEISEEFTGKPENIDTEAIFHPEVPVAVARDEKVTNRTPEYIMTMNAYVKMINKDN